nr:hypothetical protein [Methylorubrum extorquens]
MLSRAYEEKRIKVFPVAVEPKLDGFRGMSLVTGGVSKAFSRVGNHFPQLDWAGPYLADMVAAAHDKAYNLFVAGSGPAEHFYRWLGGEDGPSCALDGEMMTRSYAETSGELRRKGNEAKDALLYLFDAVPYAFMRDPTQIEWKVPLRVRRKFLKFIVAHAPEGAPIRLTDFREINSHEEIIEVYNEHRSNKLEGAMVKPLEGHYVRKKGHIWQKIKAEETEDLRIIGWQTGEPGRALEDKFAGFLVEREHNGEMVVVAVGGGYKHDELAFWDAEVRKMPAGEPWTVNGKVRRRFLTPFRLCEVEFHEVTPDGSLRHPRFVRFRDDKDENLRVAA